MRNAWILFLLCLCCKRKSFKKIYYWIGLGASKKQAKVYEECTRIYDSTINALSIFRHGSTPVSTVLWKWVRFFKINIFLIKKISKLKSGKWSRRFFFNCPALETPWHFQLENHLSLSSVGYTVLTCESERNASASGWLNAEHHVTDEIDKTRLAHIRYNMEIDLDK